MEKREEGLKQHNFRMLGISEMIRLVEKSLWQPESSMRALGTQESGEEGLQQWKEKAKGKIRKQ